MLCIRGIVPLVLLVWLIASAVAAEDSGAGDNNEKTITEKKSLDGVAMFTVTVATDACETEPIRLSLRLKNLGETPLVISDRPIVTFALSVYKKNGESLPSTRYLKELIKESKRADRYVVIELPLNKEASVALRLERLFDLSLEGEYFVSAEARFTVNRVPGKIAIEKLPFRVRSTPFVRITKVK